MVNMYEIVALVGEGKERKTETILASSIGEAVERYENRDDILVIQARDIDNYK